MGALYQTASLNEHCFELGTDTISCDCFLLITMETERDEPQAGEQRHHAEVDEEDADGEVDDGVVDTDVSLALQDKHNGRNQTALSYTANTDRVNRPLLLDYQLEFVDVDLKLRPMKDDKE